MTFQSQCQFPTESAPVRPAKGRSGYVVLKDGERDELVLQLRAEGDERLAKEIGASKYALVRAAVGLEVQAGTAALVRGWMHGRVR